MKERKKRKRKTDMGIRKGLLFTGLIVVMLLTGCSETDVTDQVANVAQAEDEHVLAVKGGVNTNYPDKTYGEAFDAFFSAPTWKYFKGTKESSDEDGDGNPDSEEENVDVVEFTGYCTYQDVDVKAVIQFTLNDDDTFTASYLSFNEVPQNMLMLSQLLDTVFTYDDNAGTESTEDSEEMASTETIE